MNLSVIFRLCTKKPNVYKTKNTKYVRINYLKNSNKENLSKYKLIL